MVYGNYHQEYIKPNCDLCGEPIDITDLHIRVETLDEEMTCGSDEHQGHLCGSCNEFELDNPNLDSSNVEYHVVGGDPCKLLMIEVRGFVKESTTKESIQKHSLDTAPEFLVNLGYAIAGRSKRVESIPIDNPQVDEMYEQFYETIRNLK